MPRVLAVVALTLALPAIAAAQEATADALFDQGETFQAFLEKADARRELWLQNTERAAPAESLVGRLRAVAGDLRLLVIAVPACSDSVSTVPYLAALADRAGVPLRIVNSTVGRHLMDQHPTPDGRGATPTIVLLRGDAIAGVFVERPKALQDWYLSAPAQALDQRDRVSRKMSWYDWDRGDSTMAEIVALAEAHVH